MHARSLVLIGPRVQGLKPTLNIRARRVDLWPMDLEGRPPRATDMPHLSAHTPAECARTILQLYLDQKMDRLPGLIHPEAELEAGFAAPGAQFDADGVLDAAWAAVSSGAYRPEYEVVESLDDDTALVGARIRYVIGEGLLSERAAAYLMTFRDGLLWRTRIFDSVDEALSAYRASQR